MFDYFRTKIRINQQELRLRFIVFLNIKIFFLYILNPIEGVPKFHPDLL